MIMISHMSKTALILVAGGKHSTHYLAPTKTKKSSKGSRSVTSNSSRKPAPEFGDGWTMAEVERKSGKTAGTKYKYWWSPSGKKFRSKAEVGRFKEALCNNGGDEEAAWEEMKPAKKSLSATTSEEALRCARTTSDGDSVATTGTSISAFAGSSSGTIHTGKRNSEGLNAVTPSPNREFSGRSDAQDCASDGEIEKKRRYCFI